MDRIKLWKCVDCGGVCDEAPPTRECSNENCGEVFTSDDRACPSCNRPFTRKLYEHGCQECNEEAEEVEVYGKCPKCSALLLVADDPTVADFATSNAGIELCQCADCGEWFPAEELENPL